MDPLIKRSLLRSLGFSLLASLAIYAIAWTFFNIHEEAGVPAQDAFPIAAWAFPVMLLLSSIFLALRNAGTRKR